MKDRKALRKSFAFAWKQTLRHDKRICFYSFLTVPLYVFNRLADIYLVALIAELVTQGAEQRLLGVTAAFAAYKLLSELTLRFSDWQLSTRNYRSKMRFVSGYAAQYMRTDFAVIESTAGKDRAQRAKNAMAGVDYRDKSAVETFLPQCAALTANLCGLFVYAGIIAALNPLMIALLVFTAATGFFLHKAMVQYDQKDKARYIPLERRLWYLIQEMRNLGAAKDIRLYGLTEWLRQIFRENLSKRMALHRKRNRLQYLCLVISNLINTAFTGYIYYYLIAQYWGGSITISQFLLYFGLITGFNAWLMAIADGIEGLHRTLLNINDLRLFQALPNPSANTGEGLAGVSENGIRFEHVSFGYSPEKNVIQDMSFTIAPGEKIAVVGLNGAGKTTLVKLLCGLYAPDAGKIFLGGRDIQSFSKEELFSKFSVVFQDIYLLPTTIERNITLSDTADSQRLERVLSLSGLTKKIRSLPEREKTVLVKSVLENAIELSGGEMQKLALARALYKGGEIIILDEPTAKLDPLAESEMYQKYHALTKGKTSIFISHRLSSTQFCDRIFYLENGVIAECGTHEALVAQGGAYARMFEIQSQYYRTDVRRKTWDN